MQGSRLRLNSSGSSYRLHDITAAHTPHLSLPLTHSLHPLSLRRYNTLFFFFLIFSVRAAHTLAGSQIRERSGIFYFSVIFLPADTPAHLGVFSAVLRKSARV